MQTDMRTNLREQTEKNLQREPEVSQLRMSLETARAEVQSLNDQYNSLKLRQDAVLKRYSQENISSELEQAINQANQESADLKEKLENEELKIVQFVNKLVKVRKMFHLRQIKKARLQTLTINVGY